jgi:hypothetical protein
MTRHILSWLSSGVCAAVLVLLLYHAFGQTPFYQGKTVTVIISTAPGGTGDLWTSTPLWKFRSV